MKKALSFILAFALVLSLFAGGGFGVGPDLGSAALADNSNSSGTAEGNSQDVFAALGFDTSETPEGFEAETTENPYGRDTVNANQVFEVLLAGNAGYALYGHNDNSASPNSIASFNTQASSLPMALYAAAAGDFDGDSLTGEVAYVGVSSVAYDMDSSNGVDKASLVLCVGDAATGACSGAITLAQISPYYTPSASAADWQKVVQASLDASWQNLLQITAGDYDGDGISEIAVYVPESGNARVDVYKYQMTSSSGADGWLESGAWERVWSYAVSSGAYAVPNMVSLCSGDFNKDGVDDLGISYGRAVYAGACVWDDTSITYYYTGALLESTVSKAAVLWGGTSRMLQKNAALNLGADKLGSLSRVSLSFGDADGDGVRDLIMAGQPLADLPNNESGNCKRAVGFYAYDETAGLVLFASDTIENMAYETQTYTTYDSEGNPTVHTDKVSKNGYDLVNYSKPYMNSNVAVITPAMGGDTYIYVDSMLIYYYESTLTLKYELNDDKNCDASSGGTLLWCSRGDDGYKEYLNYGSYDYCEYAACAGDINGGGNEILITAFTGSSNVYNKGFNGTVADASQTGFRRAAKGVSVLWGDGGAASGLKVRTTRCTYASFSNNPGTTMTYPLMADTDVDTTIIEYTGVHYLTYSDPKVLAVIAAAPYFEDVDVITDYDYAWQNTTSWATTKGEGGGSTVSVDFETGVSGEIEATIAGAHVAFEAAVGFTMEWEKENTTTTEYTLTFETSGDEDSVAFMCIPTECYLYAVYAPDGNGGYTKGSTIITNTFSPCYQVLSLDYYESIQGDYDDLPRISGAVLTSTPGDPGSYPASVSGYNLISQWNDKPAGVSFGNGAITQEITITEEETTHANYGCNMEFKVGNGGEGWSIFQARAKAKASWYFSLNPAGGTVDIDISGTTISGAVANMPVEFQDYGYYYAWKLFSYSYTFDDGTTIPVVSYVVTDVSEPPALPEDFQQNYERSTSSSNCLTWTYGGSASAFSIYKYYDFPQGGGLKLLEKVSAGDAAHYTLKTDSAGKPYKEYYYVDGNLSPYTQYRYAIQVERSTPVPPLSAPSALLTARTKAASGYPVMTVSESDNRNDGQLLIYPDKNAYLTVGVTGPNGESAPNYYTTVQYQWQKMVSGAWTDLSSQTSLTLTFAGSGVADAGVYRCRVNAQTKSQSESMPALSITAFTEPVAVTHSKRTAQIAAGDLSVTDTAAGGIRLYARVTNAHADSASVPSGTVNFTLVSADSGIVYQYAVALDGGTGIADEELDAELPQGIYSVYAYYSGSYIFKACSAETSYMADLSSGYSVSGPASLTYGDGGQLSFLRLSKVDGMTSTAGADAGAYGLYRADTAGAAAIASAERIADTAAPGSVVRGRSYYYTDAEGDKYYFTATRTGAVARIEGSHVFYGEEDLALTYLEYTGAAGVYNIGGNLPVGGYVAMMQAAGQPAAYGSFTVLQRPLTFRLPADTGSEGVDEAHPKLGGLELVSGSWAGCDLSGGAPVPALADLEVALTYTNTAGAVFSNTAVDKNCGYYVTSCAPTDTLAPNYRITFLDGSLSILGATKALTVGARFFEGQDVGTVYVTSPDYAYTRYQTGDSLGRQIGLHYQAGTRVVLYAVPDAGYEVDDWYVNGVAQNNASTSLAYVMRAEDTVVEVQFIITQNTLTFGASGDRDGGTVSCSDGGLASGSTVLSNSQFTFTAAAAEGYHFKEWRYSQVGGGTAYYTEDEGEATSVFRFTMPDSSCSLYAVFERDFYTLTLSDRSGGGGLVAYYYAVTESGGASGEKTYVESGGRIKGGTQVTVEPAVGYLIDKEARFVSVGSQGTAAYASDDEDAYACYVFTILENTEVSCATARQDYSLTLAFDVSSRTSQPTEGVITYTVNGEAHTFSYDPAAPSRVVEGILGGSRITVSGEHASYYVSEGWENSLKQVTASTTVIQAAAALTEQGQAVTKDAAYRYSDTDPGTGATSVWYFTAPETGTVRWDGASATVWVQGDSYAVDELGADMTLTLHLTEELTRTVTLTDISGSGTYAFALPEGATQTGGTAGGDGGFTATSAAVTVHEGDTLTVTVAPAAGRTVSYWTVKYTPVSAELTSKYRATSLSYALKDIAYDYSITPVFSATTYNTITWPSISGERSGLTLTPVDCLSSVASGSDFTFRFTGDATAFALLKAVYANGNEFLYEGDAADGYRYTYTRTDAGDKSTYLFKISNITENQVVTAAFNEVGVTVDGVDISAFSGTGWSYDAAAQVLTIDKSSRTLSGANNPLYAPNLTVLLGSAAASVTFSGLRLASSTQGALITAARTGGVSITASGANALTCANGGSGAYYLLHAAGDLTVRGSGSLACTLTPGGTAPVSAVYSLGNILITGTVDMTVGVPSAANSASVGLRCVNLDVGVAGSENSNPRLKVNMGFDEAARTFAYASTGVYASAALSVYGGELKICANRGLYARNLNNYDGIMEVYSNSSVLASPSVTTWRAENPTGFLICYGDSDTAFDMITCSTYDASTMTYVIENIFDWLRTLYGLEQDSPDNPIYHAYLRLSPMSDFSSGASVSADGSAAADIPATGTYYYALDGGVLKAVSEADIESGTVYLARSDEDGGVLRMDLREYLCEEATQDHAFSTATLTVDELAASFPLDELSEEGDGATSGSASVVRGERYYFRYGYPGTYGWTYAIYHIVAAQTGTLAYAIDTDTQVATGTVTYLTVGARTYGEGEGPETRDFVFSGVADNLKIDGGDAGHNVGSLELSGLSAMALSLGADCDTVSLRGDNYLTGAAGEACLAVDGGRLTLSGDASGSATLTLINSGSSGSGLVFYEDGAALTLNGVRSVTAYGQARGIVSGSAGGAGCAVAYTGGGLTALYGYGWLMDSGSSSPTAATQKGALVGSVSVAAGAAKYLKFYAATADATAAPALVYDQNTGAGNATIAETTVCYPAVLGVSHEFDPADTTCSVTILKNGAAVADLASGTDYAWARDGQNARGTLTLLTDKGAVPALEKGDYVLLLRFYDEDVSDAKKYELSIPLSVVNTYTSLGLSVSPETVTAGRDASIAFTTAFVGTTPAAYEWTLTGGNGSSALSPAAGGKSALTVGAAEALGNLTVTVRSYSDAGKTHLLGEATATVTVVRTATAVGITCMGETPSGDGSFTIYHNSDSTAKTCDFNARVTFDDGSVLEDAVTWAGDTKAGSHVAWTVQGAQKRGTSVAPGGVLTIASDEVGTGGKLTLTASYTDADGTKETRTIEIWLSTDAHVAWTAAGAKGHIASVVYGVSQTAVPAAGAWIPANTQVVARAVPDTDYKVSHWYVNGEDAAGNGDYTVSADGAALTFTAAKMGVYVITADYINVNNFSVTYAKPENGSLSASLNGAALTSGTRVLLGSDVVFTAVPDAFYRVRSWTVNGAVYEQPAGTVYTGTSLTLSGIAADQTVAVTFEGAPVAVAAYAGINPADNTAPHGTVTIFDDGAALAAAGTVQTDHSVYYAATVAAYSDVLILANPESGYQVKAWYLWNGTSYDEIGGTAEVASFSAEDVTGTLLQVKVVFEARPVHTVAVSILSYENGEGAVTSGTFKVSTPNAANLTARHHDTLTLLATPAQGSCLYDWTVTGAAYTRDGNSVTLTDITGDVQVKARFRKLFYELGVAAAENGVAAADYAYTAVVGGASGTVAEGGAELVRAGSAVTVYALPDAGSMITSFRINGDEAAYALQTSGGYAGAYTCETLSLDASLTAEVVFGPILRHDVTAPGAVTGGTLTAGYDPADGISTDADAGDNKVEIRDGGTALLTAVPDAGYTVDADALFAGIRRVLTDARSAAAFSVKISGGGYQVTIAGVDADLDFSGIIPPFTPTTGPDVRHTVTFGAGAGGTLTAAYNGVPLESGSSVPEGEEVVFTAVPDAHWALNHVSLGGSAVSPDGGPARSPYTFTLTADADISAAAVFEAAEYLVTINVLGTGHGTVTAAPAAGAPITATGYLPAGSTVTVTAAPAAGSAFNCMAVGADTGFVSGGSFTLSEDTVITAVFDVSAAPVTYNVPQNGTLTVTDSSGQAVLSGALVPVGTTLVITAVPDAHYKLGSLTAGGSAVLGNTYTVSAGKVNAVSAVFALKEARVTWTNPAGGTINVTDASGAALSSGDYVALGGSIIVRALPVTANYEITSLTINAAGNYTAKAAEGFKYVMTAAGAAVAASFKYTGDAPPDGGGTTIVDGGGTPLAGGTYTVEFTCGQHGALTILADGEELQSGDTVAGGTELVITAKADDGYGLKSLTVNGNQFTSGGVYVVYANTTVTAKFSLPAGLPYYLDGGGNRVFIGFSLDADADGVYGDGEYIAPAGKKILFASNAKTFSDVPEDWSAASIGFVTEREIFLGTGETLFSPGTFITRAMFAAVLGRLYERSYGGIEPSAVHAFNDCDYDDYYGRYVDWAAVNGIITGYGGGRFGPEDMITREQMATMLYRFAKFLEMLPAEMDTVLRYPDASKISAYAKDPALYCQSTDIITGTTGGAFDPQANATRAQTAAIITRFITHVMG